MGPTKETSYDVLHNINDQVRPWVDLIDRLRAVGIEKDLAIPQIAVMGDQSSGKSSVLEALSGVQFPRGAGLVTKCATELRMKNRKDAPWSAHISLTWDQPQPIDAGPVNSPEELGGKITKLTEVLLLARGKYATFESEHSILIELTSPDVPDLTIIDLPGIVRTTLEGQSKTVMAEVDSLLQKYLEQERTVILAVIPSNVDLATVDIIERANKADFDGKRTVGVLTKPDMIPEGEEGEKVDTLMNLTKPLKLGYIMVKNRSQKQIDEGVDLAGAKEYERMWFQNHGQFGKMDKSFFGVDNLAQKLTAILLDRIKESLPQLHKEISKLITKTQEDLNVIGAAPPQSPEQMRATMLDIMQLVTSEIKSAVTGTYDTQLLAKKSDLRIFARFRKFQEKFNQAVLQSKPKWTVGELKEVVSAMRGREMPGFPKPAVLDYLVSEYVQTWEVSMNDFTSLTKIMTVEACEHIVEHHVPKYRRLAAAMKTALQDILQDRMQNAKTNVLKDVIRNELSPMTMNHYFMDTYNKILIDSFARVLDQCLKSCTQPQTAALPQSAALSSAGHNITVPAVVSNLSPQVLKQLVLEKYREIHGVGSQSNEDYEAENLMAILEAYWKTSSKRFVDNAIQNIDRVLLRDLDVEASKHFALHMESPERFGDFFSEEHNVKEARARLEAKLARLKQAQRLLAEV